LFSFCHRYCSKKQITSKATFSSEVALFSFSEFGLDSKFCSDDILFKPNSDPHKSDFTKCFSTAYNTEYDFARSKYRLTGDVVEGTATVAARLSVGHVV
jgi:hypothetical protein